MSDKFDIAFEHLIDNEGWIANDKYDIGGKTILGIASRYHKAWYDKVYNAYKIAGREAALKLAKMFYQSEFWDKNYNFINDSSLAFRLFDFGVNAGKRKAVKIFQKTINFFKQDKIKVDGKFGSESLVACNGITQERLYLLFTIRIYLYYLRRPTAWKHLRGWTLRLVKRYWLE